MKLIKSFDPSAAPSGTFDPQTANACGRIYLFNESGIGLQLNFGDGSVQGLPPYYFRSYKVSRPGPVEWKMLYSLQATSSPLSVVIGESYESSEAKDIVFTEGPLNRQTNVANIVNTAGGTVAIVQNDGNPAGTTIVEATPAGKPQAVLLTNDGNLVLGDTTNFAGALTVNGSTHLASTFTAALDAFGTLTLHSGGTFITFVPGTNVINVLINGSQVFQINAGGIDLNILSGGGSITANTIAAASNINFKIGGGQAIQINSGGIDTNIGGGGGSITTQSLTLVNGSNTAKWSIDASGNVALDRPNGTRNFQINAGGIDLKASGHNLSANQVVFGVGSISALSMFTGAASGTYSHGLGAIPDIIVPMTSVLGSQTMGYDSLTSTQCHITSGSGLGFKAIAIKQ